MKNEMTIDSLEFPDPRKEAFERAAQFRRLSPEQKVAYMRDVIEAGMTLLRISPHRRAMDRVFLEREAEWQRIQRRLFAHAK